LLFVWATRWVFRPSPISHNRDCGSPIASPVRGARAVLDSGLKQAGIGPDRIGGYETEYSGHLEVGSAIASGQADTGVTLRVAADAYNLEFIPLSEERYDLVILAAEADTPPGQSDAQYSWFEAVCTRDQPVLRLRHGTDGTPGRAS